MVNSKGLFLPTLNTWAHSAKVPKRRTAPGFQLDMRSLTMKETGEDQERLRDSFVQGSQSAKCMIVF